MRAVEAEVVGAALVGSQGSQEPWPSGAASRRVRAASERGEREPVGIECRPSGAVSERGECAASRWVRAASGHGERAVSARAASERAAMIQARDRAWCSPSKLINVICCSPSKQHCSPSKLLHRCSPSKKQNARIKQGRDQ